MKSDLSSVHAARMSAKYRHARWVYDLTRKFFLVGRDRGLNNLGLGSGVPSRVLEIGCGTGRNIQALLRTHAQVAVDGVDIAYPMLEAARHKLKHDPRVRLALGDATELDVQSLFGVRAYDAVLMSYSLSMVPEWRQALKQALLALRVGGRLSMVDFGDFQKWGPLGPLAIASLGHYDAPPLLSLRQEALALDPACYHVMHQSLWGGVAQTVVVTRLA